MKTEENLLNFLVYFPKINTFATNFYTRFFTTEKARSNNKIKYKKYVFQIGKHILSFSLPL